MAKLIFKTLLLKGAQGSKGDGDIVPDDGVIYYDNDGDLPNGYEETNNPTNSVTYGALAPTQSAKDGDLYLHLDNNDMLLGLYLYKSNTWVLVFENPNNPIV